MNSQTTFQPAPDGWFHIAPLGTFPHPTGALQVIDAEACEAMARTFAEESRRPNFPGLLVDFDHASHDPAQPTTAAGWISALEPRGDGLYAQVRWSDLGHEALTGGRYRLASPVWNRADCEEWCAPFGDDRDALHLRPRRLDRLALTNDPNLPGLMPLSNRREKGEGKKEKGPNENPDPLPPPFTLHPLPFTLSMNLRTELVNGLRLAAGAGDGEIVEALRAQAAEVESLRNRCARLSEAQVEHDLERFADVITNREVVRAQLLANRDGALALLGALRVPAAPAPLHQPGLYRPNLALLSPLSPEPETAAARRVANRARQLQSQLKIGHHAAFRLAEGEAAETTAA
jgi:phage I-like protein